MRPVDPADVVTVGESMAMVTPMRPVPLEEADALTIRVGGAESNVAMYLAGLGHPVRWISRLGDDPLGRIVLRDVGAAGVDTSEVTIDPSAHTGVYFKDPGETHTGVHYYRDGSAASALAPAYLDRPSVRAARVLHLTGITAALSPTCLALLRHAVSNEEPHRPLVSFDVNYRPGLWTVKEAAPVLAEIADRSDLVLVGLDEAQRLWACHTPADVRALLPHPGVVVVKDGGVGAFSLRTGGTAGTIEEFVPAPTVDVVEPVGAGDAFAAGYLSASLRGADDQHRLRLGHLVAAQALGVTGDHAPLPEKAWFAEHLAQTTDEWSRLDLTARHRTAG
jgi:2-dehydro-3-deoxygluconokinase